jgi:hypothetical protein
VAHHRHYPDELFNAKTRIIAVSGASVTVKLSEQTFTPRSLGPGSLLPCYKIICKSTLILQVKNVANVRKTLDTGDTFCKTNLGLGVVASRILELDQEEGDLQ